MYTETSKRQRDSSLENSQLEFYKQIISVSQILFIVIVICGSRLDLMVACPYKGLLL